MTPSLNDVTSLFTKLLSPGDYEGNFGLRVKLPPAYLSTTQGGDFDTFNAES